MKPAPALIYKLKNKFRYHIIIKSIKKYSLHDGEKGVSTENLLKRLENHILESGIKHSMNISIEIDPLSFY